MVQDPEPPPSPEEQDQRKRSTNKQKPNDSDGKPVEENIVGDAMEESPQSKENTREDEEIPDLEDVSPKAKRALNLGETPVTISYKDRLLGINGRGNDDCSGYNPLANRNVEVGSEAFGPWMIPRRQRRMPRPNQSKSNNNNPKGNSSIITVSRFGSLANLEQEQAQEDAKMEPIIELNTPPTKDMEKTTMKLSEAKNETGTSNLKPRQKKVEINISNQKRQGPNSQAVQQLKRQSKKPLEKVQEHTLVTSQAQGTRNLTVQHNAKSPLKNREDPSKTNNGQDPPKYKQRKPPDYEESLRLIKMAERNLADPDTLLSDLGAVQVYTNNL
ncbi:uncharacterized protein G2W53_016617 [Senna tora]|uniref:Uncharacterized protein n=1 Tax=Senna tora TaxID=362788 RepID=A0A834WLP3_9FABA|nr:uncharacterized protein G2W53_016617 [Senna tora]